MVPRRESDLVAVDRHHSHLCRNRARGRARLMADLSVRFVGTAAEIPAALWERCFPPPLEGRWWYQTLEASSLEDQFTFTYAVVHDGAEPVGIAPAFTMRVPIGVVLPSALAFLNRWFPALFHPLALMV